MVRIVNYRKLAYMNLVWCHAVTEKKDVKNNSFFNSQEKKNIAAADCYVTMEASSSETRTCGVATGVPTAVNNRLFHRVLLARGKV